MLRHRVLQEPGQRSKLTSHHGKIGFIPYRERQGVISPHPGSLDPLLAFGSSIQDGASHPGIAVARDETARGSALVLQRQVPGDGTAGTDPARCCPTQKAARAPAVEPDISNAAPGCQS